MSNCSLNLDKVMISDLLNNYEGCSCTKLDAAASQDKYKLIRKDNGDTATIVVYHVKGGKTTLVHESKPEFKSFSEELIMHIKENATILELDKVNDIIIVSQEDFEMLYEMLNSDAQITQKTISGGIQYTYEGENKERFLFKYFNRTNKLQLQGAPLKFFMKIINILDELGYDATKRIIENVVDGDVDYSSLWDEYMPSTQIRLQPTVKSIIEPSLVLMKIYVRFPDYGFMLQPVLRGMESALRSILEDNGIEVDPKRFDVFSMYYDGYVLEDEYHGHIEGNLRKKVEKCYNFYNKHRHTLFHASDVVLEIKCIETRDEAIDLLNKSFEIMEELHETVSNGG